MVAGVIVKDGPWGEVGNCEPLEGQIVGALPCKLATVAVVAAAEDAEDAEDIDNENQVGTSCQADHENLRCT